MSHLRTFLKKHRRIALDSNIFIYWLEANPAYMDAAGEAFSWLEKSNHSGVTSTLTMTELLVHPYRASNQTLVDRYYGLLTTFPNLEWVAPDLAIADAAARIRALHGLRTPDAIQVATAIRSGATGILTNDPAFARVTEIETAVLGRLQ